MKSSYIPMKNLVTSHEIMDFWFPMAQPTTFRYTSPNLLQLDPCQLGQLGVQVAFLPQISGQGFRSQLAFGVSNLLNFG